MDSGAPQPRDGRPGPSAAVYRDAVVAFVELVAIIPHDAWDLPGLGEWTVRDLVGHANRALTTVEEYLQRPAAPGAPAIRDAVAYYEDARTVDPAAIARRGRDAGRALGNDPSAAVRDTAARVLALVDRVSPQAVVSLATGATMPLDPYLDTRIFELAVHCLDIARALDATPPEALAPAVAAALETAARLAARGPDAATVLLALTGRGGLAVSVV